ncbi:MAG: hypothetical protein OEW68_14610 [Gammaproteobacteria bacterium]|nr:hypothetical protein [Gammaproteobacteria bacterium]MDH4316061.1 hypothetical protein [Gammaproteobacteria bacterium]MDH5213913.1 hypothetical protein [Gammaproteobacteria bacterium]
MSDKSTNWTELREFRAVDLTESFVLSWDAESGSLQIDLDLFLCPEHAFYERPRPKERACFRPATLEFPYCSRIESAQSRGNSDAVSEAAAKLAGGRISGLRLIDDGRYEMKGVFGKVEIHAERPILRLKELNT